MKCPLDGADLQMTERQGIEIDYCPTCRGVWLDRGELDKIIERGSGSASSAPQSSPYPERTYRDDDHHGSHGHKKHRREGLLGELFDF
ncbi:MAG TPA: zf-TFIIB domain-containing protein [Candidatus Paceibacterota bacterium]|nr:zf-TFIIB domain-containing protein [Candidatus Paceibacterota bacterium]